MMAFASFFSWRGRVSRATWLGRTVVVALVAIAFGLLLGELAGDAGIAFASAAFVASAASLAARRLHDIGKSAGSLLVALVPVIGPLWLVFQLTRAGVEGRNRYGDDPGARFDYLQVDISR